MCEVMERYEKKAAEEANVQANIRAIKKMITDYSATKESILEDYTEDEYNAAVKEMQMKPR